MITHHLITYELGSMALAGRGWRGPSAVPACLRNPDGAANGGIMSVCVYVLLLVPVVGVAYKCRVVFV